MSEEKAKKGFHLSARDLRLYTGLALAVFITSHLINHALRLVSINAMENYRKVHSAIWQSPPGVVVLYGSIAIHFSLGFIRPLPKKPFAPEANRCDPVGLRPACTAPADGTRRRIARYSGDIRFRGDILLLAVFLWLNDFSFGNKPRSFSSCGRIFAWVSIFGFA